MPRRAVTESNRSGQFLSIPFAAPAGLATRPLFIVKAGVKGHYLVFRFSEKKRSVVFGAVCEITSDYAETPVRVRDLVRNKIRYMANIFPLDSSSVAGA